MLQQPTDASSDEKTASHALGEHATFAQVDYSHDGEYTCAPILSAIMPIYNVENYVDEALEHLVGQTLAPIQIILVDDGSTDGSSAIAQRWAHKHDNVEYYRTENLGQGHARNFGLQFARGTYIAFPDSDDKLELWAYEALVDLAEQHHADIAYGGADRIRTHKTTVDKLHNKALEGTQDVSHIFDNPYLIYDSTPWNKVIRRDFFEREHIRFCEGMLYEDMPTMIFMHIKANKAVRLNKVVYHWRVREHGNRSSTQQQGTASNFDDRMKALRLVDKYINTYVDNNAVKLEKDVKALSLDLPLFIDRLHTASDEYRQHIFTGIANYLPHIDKRAFTQLDALRKIQYHYIRNQDLDGLLATCNYQKLGYDTLKIRKKQGRWIGAFPFDRIPDTLCDMTDELAKRGLRSRIRTVTLRQDGLNVSIRACMKRIDMTHVTLDAVLVDENGLVHAEFDVSHIPAHKKRVIEVSKEYRAFLVKNQRQRFFELHLSSDAIAALPQGSYFICIHVNNDGLVCAPHIVSNPETQENTSPPPAVIGTNLVFIENNYCNQMCLHVASCAPSVQDITCNDKGFSVACNNGATYSFDPKTDGSHFFISPCFAETTPRYFVRTGKDGSQLWRAIMQRDATLRISRINPGATCIHSLLQGTKLQIDITLPLATEYPVDSLVIVGRLFHTQVSVTLQDHSEGIAHVNAGASPGATSCNTNGVPHDNTSRTTLRATIYLHGNDACAIRDDTYDLFVGDFSAHNTQVLYPLYSEQSAQDTCIQTEQGGYRYTLDGRGQKMVLRVHRIRKFYERNELRKRLVQYVAYPLMRKLPLDKKGVVFESLLYSSTCRSPGALYQYLQEYHPEYRCSWILHDARIPGGKHVRNYVPNTLPYFWHIARARYLVSDSSFPDSFVKRDGQVAIQLTNGTPIRCVGINAIDPEQHSNIEEYLQRYKIWDYVTVQNEDSCQVSAQSDGFTGTFLRTGFPRTDELATHNTAQDQAAAKAALGIPPDKKLVLYAPIWRTVRRFDLCLDLSYLAKQLEDTYAFALRRHPASLPGFFNRDFTSNAIYDVSYETDVNDLLLAADVLISDYSSVIFDFAVLGRPILLYAYDRDEYQSTIFRLNYNLEEVAPGPIVTTTEQVEEILRNLDQTMAKYESQYQHFCTRFLAYESDHSSADVFEAAFTTQSKTETSNEEVSYG